MNPSLSLSKSSQQMSWWKKQSWKRNWMICMTAQTRKQTSYKNCPSSEDPLLPVWTTHWKRTSPFRPIMGEALRAINAMNTYNKQQKKTYARVLSGKHMKWQITTTCTTEQMTSQNKTALKFSLCTSTQAPISNVAHHRLRNQPGQGPHHKLCETLQKRVPASQNHN